MSQINTEKDKNPKVFSFFKDFFAFFVKVLTEFMNWNPVVFYEELIAMFWMKMSQIDTENDKNPENFQFPKISCHFSKFLTDFVNWNVAKGQQGKNVLSSMLRKAINAVFQTKIVQNWHRKRQNSKIFQFSPFLFNFCQNIDRLRWVER